jgi:hypothetical protein
LSGVRNTVFGACRVGFGRRDWAADIEEVDRDHSIFVFRSDHQDASTLTVNCMDRAGEKLHTNLKELIGISQYAWQIRLQDGA